MFDERDSADLEARIDAGRGWGSARMSWGYHVRASVKHHYLCMTAPKVACTTVKRTLHALEGLDTAHDDEDVHDQGVEFRLSTVPSVGSQSSSFRGLAAIRLRAQPI